MSFNGQPPDPPAYAPPALASHGYGWVSRFGTESPLVHAKEQAEGFGEALRVGGSTETFVRGDTPGLQKLTAADLSGAEGVVEPAEGAHLLYLTTHGSSEGLILGEGQATGMLKYGAARWGDGGGKLRWVVMDACEVLRRSSLSKNGQFLWAKTFAGLRMLLGFGTITNDEPERGRIFAEYLLEGLPIRTAWRYACQETSDRPTRALCAYLRAELPGGESTFEDTWSDGCLTAFSEDAGVEYVWILEPC